MRTLVAAPPIAVADSEDRYFRLADLARYSTLSVRQLQRFLTDPVDPLPSFHVGGHRLVHKREFDRWLQLRRERAAAVTAVLDQKRSAVRRAALALRGYPVASSRTLRTEEE